MMNGMFTNIGVNLKH